MRRIVAFLVCGLIGFSFIVQAQTIPQKSPDVEIYNFEWHIRLHDIYISGSGTQLPDYSQNDPSNPKNRNAGSSDPKRLEMPAQSRTVYSRSRFIGYESSVQLKNAGAKTITAIEWQHVFFTDESKQNELKRFEFRKRITIEPGEQKFVANVVHPRKQSKGLPPVSKQNVVIKRIEYADGSAWQRP